MDRIFSGKKWDIEREIHLPKNQRYITVMGRRARHGWILRERTTGERVALGYQTLVYVHERYLGVTLPPGIRDSRFKHKDDD